MNKDIVLQPHVEPLSAWTALVAHLDREVLEGRESFESRWQLISQSYQADMRADIRSVIARVASRVVQETLIDLENSKAPFWAKKWRGQR